MKKFLLGLAVGALAVAMFRNYVNYRIFVDKTACMTQYQADRKADAVIPCLGQALKFKRYEKILGIIIDFTGEGR